MPPRRRRNAVVDNNDGSGVPSAATTSTNAWDYTPLSGIWEEYFSSGWYALADITLVDGQSFLLPLEISDNYLSEVPQTVIWDITESGYGFTQETYTFSESDGMGFVEVSTTGTYSQVVITINDNDVIDQTSMPVQLTIHCLVVTVTMPSMAKLVMTPSMEERVRTSCLATKVTIRSMVEQATTF
jgi:hypothetical protein